MNLLFHPFLCYKPSYFKGGILMKNLFASRTGIIVVGAVIGIGAALLQYFGNPPNMGICVACFVAGYRRSD